MFCQFLSNRLPSRYIFFNCLMIPNTFLVQFCRFKSTESLIILRQSFGIDEETGTRENWCYIPDLNIKIDRREGPSPQDVSYFILVVWRCSLVRCLYGSWVMCPVTWGGYKEHAMTRHLFLEVMGEKQT